LAVLICGKNEMDKALEMGWIGIHPQGKNSNGKPRPPKYKMILEKIPPEKIVKL